MCGSRSRGQGSIPACAGEPFGHDLRIGGFRVYPRVCGGTTSGRPKEKSTHGLSPRVRGNRSFDCQPRRGHGSIPACAGEPNALRGAQGRTRVYPRVCGGTVVHVGVVFRAQGLSPRVRGNPVHMDRRRRAQRSIPACAGEPAPPIFGSTVIRVYPRVCGGTARRRTEPNQREGLSPRVRGNPG